MIWRWRLSIKIEEEKTSKYIFSGQPNRLDDEGDDSRTGSQAFRQGSKGERWSSAVSWVLTLLFRVWPRAATRSHIWRIKQKRGNIFSAACYAFFIWNKYDESPHLNDTGTGSWNKSGPHPGRTETRQGLRFSLEALHTTFPPSGTSMASSELSPLTYVPSIASPWLTWQLTSVLHPSQGTKLNTSQMECLPTSFLK